MSISSVESIIAEQTRMGEDFGVGERTKAAELDS